MSVSAGAQYVEAQQCRVIEQSDMANGGMQPKVRS